MDLAPSAPKAASAAVTGVVQATFGRSRRISADSIAAAIAALARTARLDAVFVSCTSLRLAERIEAIEADAGIPITSSDHALAWHCLRLAGVNDTVPHAGRLFACGIG